MALPILLTDRRARQISCVERIFATNFIGTLAQAMLPPQKSASGRIVNMSSNLGSLTFNSDPEWKFAQHKLLGYCASKAALNMLTLQLPLSCATQTSKSTLLGSRRPI